MRVYLDSGISHQIQNGHRDRLVDIWTDLHLIFVDLCKRIGVSPKTPAEEARETEQEAISKRDAMAKEIYAPGSMPASRRAS